MKVGFLVSRCINFVSPFRQIWMILDIENTLDTWLVKTGKEKKMHTEDMPINCFKYIDKK